LPLAVIVETLNDAHVAMATRGARCNPSTVGHVLPSVALDEELAEIRGTLTRGGAPGAGLSNDDRATGGGASNSAEASWV
jgi:hypothetical protein